MPQSLTPFEHLVGSWRSHGFLEADKLSGWDETVVWGWRFSKISGMRQR